MIRKLLLDLLKFPYNDQSAKQMAEQEVKISSQHDRYAYRLLKTSEIPLTNCVHIWLHFVEQMPLAYKQYLRRIGIEEVIITFISKYRKKNFPGT